MVKYLLNENIHGYEKTTVNNIETTKERDNMFIIIITKLCDEYIRDYYNFVLSALKNNNRVILISVRDENKSFKTLASLMLTLNGYDIYEVDDIGTVSAYYLLKVEGREPDLSEVQSYIGGDLTAYSDINAIILGIESLVTSGDIDGLKVFLETHMLSIENLSYTLDYMKKTCDTFNNNELVEVINKLKDEKKQLELELSNKEDVLNQVKYDRDANKVEADKLKRENNRLQSSCEDLKSKVESGGSVIKAYRGINTQLIKCSTKMILYFKEISYVRYTNTFIMKLLANLEMSNIKCKLIIYDNQSELGTVYKPLTVVNTSNYLASKINLLTKVKAFVVAEPNMAILQELLENDFDVVIVYDRMKGIKDLVEGNNVTKFFVINSSKDYNELKGSLGINDTTTIITNENCNIKTRENEPYMYIGTIDNYRTSSDSARTRNYIKLAYKADTPLMQAILNKSRVNKLIEEKKGR